MSVILVPAKVKKHSGYAGDCRKAIAVAASKNRALILLSMIFLTGMVLGSLYAKTVGFEALAQMDFLFAGNFKARTTQPFVSAFTASFASAFLFVLACFLCGLSMWGAFMIPLILCFRGFGLGLTSGYLYATYLWKGILYNLVVILPGAFICCLSILLAAREGIHFSRLLASGQRKTPNGTSSSLKLYILHFGIILAGICFAAGMDFLLTVCFSGLFSF